MAQNDKSVLVLKNPAGNLLDFFSGFDSPGMSLCLLLSGELKCVSSGTCRHISSRSLVIFSDLNGFSEMITSDKAKSYLLILSRPMTDSLHQDFLGPNSHGGVLSAKSTAIDKQVAEVFRLYMEALLDCSINEEAAYAGENLWFLLKAFFYKVASTLNVDEAVDFNAYDRKQQFARDFISLIHKCGGKRRDLQYYADELCLSPKYLSHVVSKATGKKCLAWIEEYAIERACTILKSTDLSISQVAFLLNYSSPSDFCRYFRNRTGMSPKVFRDSKDKSIISRYIHGKD